MNSHRLKAGAYRDVEPVEKPVDKFTQEMLPHSRALKMVSSSPTVKAGHLTEHF